MVDVTYSNRDSETTVGCVDMRRRKQFGGKRVVANYLAGGTIAPLNDRCIFRSKSVVSQRCIEGDRGAFLGDQ